MSVWCWKPPPPFGGGEWGDPRMRSLFFQPFSPSQNHLLPAVKASVRFSTQSIPEYQWTFGNQQNLVSDFSDDSNEADCPTKYRTPD